MKTFKFEFVKLSLIWRCTNGPAQFISSITFHFSLRMRNEIDDWLKWKGSGPREWMSGDEIYEFMNKFNGAVSFLAENKRRQWIHQLFSLPFLQLLKKLRREWRDWLNFICRRGSSSATNHFIPSNKFTFFCLMDEMKCCCCCGAAAPQSTTSLFSSWRRKVCCWIDGAAQPLLCCFAFSKPNAQWGANGRSKSNQNQSSH